MNLRTVPMPNRERRVRPRWPLASLVAAVTVVCCAGNARSDDGLRHSRDELDRTASMRLAGLAAWCEEQSLPEAARRTRQWLPSDRRQQLLLFDPTQPAEVAASDEPAALGTWRAKFREIRTSYAQGLFELAQLAARANQIALTMEFIGETLRNDPDHAGARRALGYEHIEGQWHTPHTAARHKAGQVWHDRFGWLPQGRIARYEAGERFHRGRWISAEQDQRLHSSIDTGWELESEHFTVTTNHSLEAAARYARELERLFAAWRQACGCYLVQDARTLLEPPAPRAYRRHQVVIFRHQAEYQQALRGEVPADGSTTGFYSTDRRTAYFFVPAANADGKQTFDNTVLYHEAVHQLFSETGATVRQPGEKQNFWLIEGIACYFESLSARDGHLVLGGTETPRYKAAEYRLLNDKFYVPLAEFCGMDRRTLQQDPRIARLYSQASGLTQFFMHEGGGSLREGFLTALRALYTGRDRPDTLADTMGKEFGELDEAYRGYVNRVFAASSRQ